MSLEDFGSVDAALMIREVSSSSSGGEEYKYPPDTPGAEQSGFLFSLTSDQREQLRQTKLWMAEHHLPASALTPHALLPELTMLRYLRGNKFNVDAATQHMTRNVAWREEGAVNAMLEVDPEVILGCSMTQYQRYLPHWHCGYDKTGRPVLYKQYGSFENDLLQFCPIEAVTRYHVWEQEVVSQLCDFKSREIGLIVETSFVVMDLEGMQMRQVTKDFLAIVKAFANIDQTQYPETLGKLLIVNAPSAFPFVWGWVKPWLDPAVASKIQIYGGPTSWQPVLFALIGQENIPANYGGTLPRLTIEDHPYQSFRRAELNQATPLSAESIVRLDASHRGSMSANRRASFRRPQSIAERTEVEELSRSRPTSVRAAGEDGPEAADRLGLSVGSVGFTRSMRLCADSHFRYPDGTPGSESADGYVFSLNEKQTSALKSAQQWMLDDAVEIGALVNLALHPNLVLLRYLRANKFDAEAAIAHMKRNVAWRREQGVEELNDLQPEQILGCSMDQYQRYLPHWQSGYDKTGRPVLYKQYGSFENDLLQFCPIEAVTRYHVWEQETVCRLCYTQSRKRAHIVETSFVVMDLEGMQMRQVTSDFLAIVKVFANIDQQQYPETLGKLLIINAPTLFPMVWRGVKSFLDPVVTSKIQIFAGPSTWQPVLFELIGPENIPVNYGGTLPRLTIEDHPYPSSLDSSSSRALVFSKPTSMRLKIDEAADDDNDSVGSLAFYDALEQQEVQDVYNIVSRRENYLMEAANSIFVYKVLTDMQWSQISRLFTVTLAFYLIITFIAMVLSAYAMHSEIWIEEAYTDEKWTAIIVVLLSFFLFVVIFVGYVAHLIKNFLMLDFFAGSLGIGSLLYLIVSISAFGYLSAGDNMAHIYTFRVLLAVGCLFLFAITMAPIVVSRALSYRCKLELDIRLASQQYRVVIRTINVVCAFFAIGMLTYGGISMNFLYNVNENISSSVYSVYGLIYCGVTIILSAAVGFWVSVTTRKRVIRVYYTILVPLIMLLLLASAITSFSNIELAKEHAASDYKASSGFSKSYITSNITTQLLISGILCIFCCIFHLLSRIVSIKLHNRLEDDYATSSANDSRFKYSDTLTVKKKPAARMWQETFIVLYGLLGGLFCIYFKGTYIVFADFVQQDSSTYTLNWLANPWFGGFDQRYTETEAYILAMEGTLALIIGPLMLLYSWSTFVRAPFRHIIGMIVTTSQIYNSFIYYGIEISHNFRDINVHGPGVLAITVIIDLCCGFFLHLFILIHEAVVLSRNSYRAYSMESSTKSRKGRTPSESFANRNAGSVGSRNREVNQSLPSIMIGGARRRGESKISQSPAGGSAQVTDFDDDDDASGIDMTMTI